MPQIGWGDRIIIEVVLQNVEERNNVWKGMQHRRKRLIGAISRQNESLFKLQLIECYRRKEVQEKTSLAIHTADKLTVVATSTTRER